MKYSLSCSVAVARLLYVIAPIVAREWIGNPDGVGVVRLFSFFLPVNCLTGVMVGYFTAANRISTLSVVEVAEQACSMGFTISLLYFWAGDSLVRACAGVVLGSGFSACFTLVCLLYRTRQIPVILSNSKYFDNKVII